MTNLETAANSVARELHVFAKTLKGDHVDEFFHPTNRDMWVRRFAEWLAEKQAASARIRASND